MIAERVERGAEYLAVAGEGLTRRTAAGTGVGGRDLSGGGGVALADLLAHVIPFRRCGTGVAATATAVAAAVGLLVRLAACGLLLWSAAGIIGQLSHTDSSFSASGMT